jgi:hypothetical protein
MLRRMTRSGREEDEVLVGEGGDGRKWNTVRREGGIARDREEEGRRKEKV